MCDANFRTGIHTNEGQGNTNTTHSIGDQEPEHEHEPSIRIFREFLEGGKPRSREHLPPRRSHLLRTERENQDRLHRAPDWLPTQRLQLRNPKQSVQPTPNHQHQKTPRPPHPTMHLLVRNTNRGTHGAQPRKWNVETLTRMVATGIGKAELIEKIEQLSKEKLEELGKLRINAKNH